ncbi:MAG: hypothetical protein ACRD6X_09505 [Pyrinomonadaceae bacterium]
MSCNPYKRHVLIIPEDDANRQIANGFHLRIDFTRQRQIQVLPECGGWSKVVDCFKKDYVPYLETYTQGHMILVIDFDKDPNRFESVKSEIPDPLTDRVYIVGAWDEPEGIKLGPLESVGGLLASDCQNGDSIESCGRG